MKIYLTKDEMERCENHAEAIVAYYDEKWAKSGNRNNYNHNKVDSNRIGVRCEVATERWISTFLQPQDYQSNFWDFKSSMGTGDIDVSDNNLEIKGLQFHQWSKFKRMIPPRQLAKYCKHNAIVIWGTSSKTIDDNEVHLKGWNWANEVKEKGVEVRTICDNIWLEDDQQMRAMSELKEILKSSRR